MSKEPSKTSKYFLPRKIHQIPFLGHISSTFWMQRIPKSNLIIWAIRLKKTRIGNYSMSVDFSDEMKRILARDEKKREKKSYDMLSRDTSWNRFPSKRCVLTSRVSLERGTYTHIKIIPTANFHALTVINEGLILLRGINTINFALSCRRWVTIDVKHWRCNYVLLISVVWNIRPFFLFFTKHNNPVLSLSFFRCLCNQR